MILCDTNVLVEFLKNNPQVTAELRAIGQNDLAISVITLAELYFGAFNKAELIKIKRNLSPLAQLPITRTASDTFIHLMETYSLSHKPSLPDMLIAATALEHNIELYTFNRKDFRFIPGLRLYQPAV